MPPNELLIAEVLTPRERVDHLDSPVLKTSEHEALLGETLARQIGK